MANNSEDLKIRLVALHKDGQGYKKFGNSLELSYSTVARAEVESNELHLLALL